MPDVTYFSAMPLTNVNMYSHDQLRNVILRPVAKYYVRFLVSRVIALWLDEFSSVLSWELAPFSSHLSEHLVRKQARELRRKPSRKDRVRSTEVMVPGMTIIDRNRSGLKSKVTDNYTLGFKAQPVSS